MLAADLLVDVKVLPRQPATYRLRDFHKVFNFSFCLDAFYIEAKFSSQATDIGLDVYVRYVRGC